MKSVEWWRGTANHLWRTYFALVRDGVEKDDKKWNELSTVKKNIYAICHHAFTHKFKDEDDRKIMQMYYTTKWGDDQYQVEDYSARTGISTKAIWIVVRRANRTIMQDVGLLEKGPADE